MSLQFSEVTRRYGDVVALNRFTLDVPPGVTALVGPNGAGKSSFMRLATGHVKPTSGTIQAFGQPVWDNPDVLARMGYVPEQDALYDRLTGVEFVRDMAMLSGFEAEAATEAAHRQLDELGLEAEARERPIQGYSKGMRQRVKLAQALVHDPDLLLLDEPMLGCDPVARERISRRIRAMAQAGKAIVVATHILPEVARMTRRIAVIAGGRLRALGDANAVRAEMADVPSRVRVLCGSPRKAAAGLAAWDEVDAVRLTGDGVDIETPRLQAFLTRLHQDRPATWKILGHQTLDADLDSLFGYLAEGSA